MRNVIRVIGLAGIIATAVSCGDVVRQGSSPVFLVIDQMQGIRGGPQAGTPSSSLVSDVITNVTTPLPCTNDSPCPKIFGDSGSATLRAPLKDIGNGATTLAATTNNEVTINRVHVSYTRADGRNTEGVDVPFAFDTAVTGTIPANGTAAFGFELVRNVAKQEAPLVALKTSSNIIGAIANVTFYGTDRTGNAIQVTGTIGVQFGNFGDF
jgi:hypothetical protein